MDYDLTRGMADRIVTAVLHDPVCRTRLPATSGFKVFGGIHQAGTARNLVNASAQSLAFADRKLSQFVGHDLGPGIEDYWDQVGSDEACTGVAAVTAKALSKTLGLRDYEFLLDARTIDRFPTDPAHDFHTATAVTVTGDHVFVFDWHSTLALGNPLIFPSDTAFRNGGPSVLYSAFWGC
ncbi:MAG TPA: hypothetical protein VIP05_10940 [Burkholderiaceae bacterium]